MKVKKIYDFDIRKTSRTLVHSLRQKQEATVADLIAATGLPKHQVEETIKSVTHEYGGRMRVTESGEILYSFPRGMKSRYEGFGPRLRRVLGRLGAWTAAAASLLFKVWIMIMLVGYFALFIAILALALVASFAGAFVGNREGGQRSRSRSMGFGSLYLVTRLIEFFIQIWLYGRLTRGYDGRRTSARRTGGRPLHRAVFAFVFGDGDPNAGWEIHERTETIRFIQSRKGVVTVEELMALTGRDYDAAQELVSALLLEYEGEPSVTDEGTLYFQFPELMRTRDLPSSSAASSAGLRKRLVPFNGNESGMNRWIAVLNSVNIFFGSFFLYYSYFAAVIDTRDVTARFYLFTRALFSGTSDPTAFIAVVLGVVPFLFSLLFYLVPFVRNLRRERENSDVRSSNFRMKVYRTVLEHPDEIVPDSVRAVGADESVPNPKEECERVLSVLGARKGVEIEERPDGLRAYRFPDIGRERNDIRDLRAGIDPSKYAPGDTVFDSGA